MTNIKQESLVRALSMFMLKELPDKDDGKLIWVKALALVKKRDGTQSYVCLKRNADTLTYNISNDFGTCSAVVEYVEIYPFSFLKEKYMPVFKGVKKEDRINYLNKINKNKDYSQYTLKELDKEIVRIAISRQLNDEKQYE